MKKITFLLLAVFCSFNAFAVAEKIQIRAAQADISAYQNYTVNNVYDGDYNTKYWSNSSPQAGFTLKVTFSSKNSIGDIKLYFAEGDLPTEGAVVEISPDDETWEEVGSFNGADYSNSFVTLNAGGKEAKFVRLRFTKASDKWFQLKEFEVYEYEAELNSRTISATVNGNGSVTVNGGTDAVTSTGKVVLKAEPAYGYKFVNWTVNGEEVSTASEYIDETEGDKEFVANFARYESVNEWYAAYAKPTFSNAGGTTKVSSIKFDEADVTDFAYVAGATSRVNNAVKVFAGETYNLDIQYELRWGDLAVYQLDVNGAEKKYGYYTCEWKANGDPLTILESGNSALICEELGIDEFADLETVIPTQGDKFITLPYNVTIDEKQQPGDLILIRLIVGKKGNNNSAYEQNIIEGGCLDILLEVEGDGEETVVESVKISNGKKDIFDLQGRCINKITESGIYIINGKKVLIK